jgi:D-alanyl-D-alanine-carboxypeptidase/D-alanyl-D-alanine-endopeptidase
MWRAQHAVVAGTHRGRTRQRPDREIEVRNRRLYIVCWLKTKMKTSNCMARTMALLFLSFAGLVIGSRPPRAQGALGTGPGKLQIVLTIFRTGDGKFTGILESVTQSAKFSMGNITLAGTAVHFEVKDVGGVYQGSLSKEGGEINGTWTQTGVPAQRLNFSWQGATPAKPAGPALAPAGPPVALADLKEVLDREFAPVLDHGVLAKATGSGVVIGVYDHGQTRIFNYGTAQPDSIFEIGSVTKTFTALVLAQMVEQKKVSLDDPVRTLLPEGTVAKPDGPEITLENLATQHSGLPRLPDNLKPANMADPYADYRSAQLYEFLKKRGVARPKDPGFLYSNLGFGLLGYALSLRAGMSYEDLIKTQITNPLQMKDTVVTLSPSQQTRMIGGHDVANKPAGRWTWDTMAGAGSLVSTAADMLKYLEANLHPEKIGAGAAAGSPLATLPAALASEHQPRASGPSPLRIALAWLCNDENHACAHDGGTGGYTSFISFMPKDDRAIVVLYNRGDTSTGDPFTDRVFTNIVSLMAGEKVPPLEQ